MNCSAHSGNHLHGGAVHHSAYPSANRRRLAARICSVVFGISCLCGVPAVFLFGAAPLAAQGDTTKAAEPAPTHKADLADWWMRNAASFDSIPDQWLFRAEADYSFSLQTGNIEGETHNGRGRVFLRKQRSTFSLRAGVQSQKLSLARGVLEVEQEHYRLLPALDYDITPALGLQAGFLWEHDDAAFIETREIGYLGLKAVPYSSRELIISLLPAFGYQYEQAILTNEERSFWTPYLEETIMWQPIDRLRIHHEGNFLLSLEDAETYRWRIANAVEIPVTSFFSVMFNYEMRYNNNPIPSGPVVRRLTNGQGAISRRDNELTAGFRLQY